MLSGLVGKPAGPFLYSLPGYSRAAKEVDEQRTLVMEVKRTDSEKEDLTALAKKSLEQIAERRNNVDLAGNPDIKTVLHWSVAFCRKDCAPGPFS